MSGEVYLITFIGTAWDVVVGGFLARPIFWTAYVVWIVAAGVSAFHFLERNGWRGFSYGALSLSCFVAITVLGDGS